MKNITPAAAMVAIGLSLCPSAHAQGHPGGGWGQRPSNAQKPAGAPSDAASAVSHLTEVFAKVAPFDANNDGQIDAKEKQDLADAIASGTVQAPAHRTPPAGIAPDAGQIANRIARMYSQVDPYDANHDGVLSEAEQAALKAAIESGEVSRPGGPRGQRPDGVGGPRR